MVEIIENIGLVILGALLTLLTQWILERSKIRRRKQAALLRLDRMISAVSDSVAHGHNFRNKGDWQTELDDLANADRSWLGDLYEPIKKISWMIRDHTFDHGEKDASEYCCDELLTDLCLLQFEILRLLPLSQKQTDERAKKLAHEFLANVPGSVGPPIRIGEENQSSERVEDIIREWRAGTLNEKVWLAESSVWRTRKRS